MYPLPFSYERPKSLGEAIDLLTKFKGDARPLAGGMSLIPLAKLRVFSVGHLIDINRIPEMKGIKETSGSIEVGALTTNAEILKSKLVREKAPLLAEAAINIGDVQVRNVGTIGGGIVECDPAGDWPPAVLALRAQMIAQGPNGERAIDADDFFLDPYTVALEEDELLVRIKFNEFKHPVGVSHVKLERRTGDFAVGIVDTVIEADSNGKCSYVGIAVGAIAAKPFRLGKAEDLIKGKAVNQGVLEEAAEIINEALNEEDILSDFKAPGEYRKDVAGSLLKESIASAYEMAVGHQEKK